MIIAKSYFKKDIVDNILNFVQQSIKCLNNIEEMKDFNWKFVPRLDVDNG